MGSTNTELEATRDMPRIQRELGIGETIGRFEIRGKLGEGGFGTVFQAYDPKLQRMVAIKLPRIAELSAESRESLLHEAQSAAQLRDPNIVAVHEVDYDQDILYVVADYIPGESLSTWMKGNRATIKQAAQWCITMARALHHAHQSGIVHRDFKPGNVILDRDHVPYVTDFGLARRSQPEGVAQDVPSGSSGSDSAGSGAILGTPTYMSPEQAAGFGADAGPPSDIYSLGVILFELLTGRRPFLGTAREVLRQTVSSPAPALRTFNPAVSKELEAICLKALAKVPCDRFASSADLADDLERFLEGVPTKTQPPPWPVRFARMARRHWVPSSIGVGLTILILLGAFGWLAMNRWMMSRARVLLETVPPGARVALVPLDPVTGVLREDRVIRPAKAEKYFLTLETGWYLVEAYDPQVGVQEAFRFLSRNSLDYIPSFRATEPVRFEADGRIVWQPIVIMGQAHSSHRQVELQGGSFKTGSDISPAFPLTEVDLPPWMMDEKEVSLKQFQEVLGRPPVGMVNSASISAPTSPARFVRYHEALEYAEKVGLRLPTVDEYLFAATNGGTTKFPWGNSKDEITEWNVAAPEPPAYDWTRLQPPVAGLFSRVLEWTQTTPPPLINPETHQPFVIPNLVVAGEPRDRRFLMGGGPAIRSGVPQPQEYFLGPRGLHLEPITGSPQPGIGFRCARSIRPRFVR